MKTKGLFILFMFSFSCPSIVQIILFIMREILIASRHYFERINKTKQQQMQPSQSTGRNSYF